MFTVFEQRDQVSRARDYLNLVLSSEGWLIALAKKGNERRQKVFATIEELIAWQQWYDRNGWDVYHACASFREQRGIWDQKGCRYKKRGHDNVLWVASLWLDIDTRESHDNARYETREQARAAIEAFCIAVRLPPPLIVSSGGGLYAIWPLAEALELAAWEALAYGLKAACLCFGLHADPSRTADASSVLRTPGMRHHKSGNIVQVWGEQVGPYPLPAFEHLKQYAGDRGKPGKGRRRAVAGRGGAVEYSYDPAPASPVRSGQPPITGAMHANIYDPSDPAKVVHACRQLAALAADPSVFSEPMHHAAAGVFGHCEDGERFYLGLLDDEWKRAGQHELDQWMGGGWGPTTCQRFEVLNPGGCDGCPFKGGEITSPIQLGRRYAPIVLPHKPPVILP